MYEELRQEYFCVPDWETHGSRKAKEKNLFSNPKWRAWLTKPYKESFERERAEASVSATGGIA